MPVSICWFATQIAMVPAYANSLRGNKGDIMGCEAPKPGNDGPHACKLEQRVWVEVEYNACAYSSGV